MAPSSLAAVCTCSGQALEAGAGRPPGLGKHSWVRQVHEHVLDIVCQAVGPGQSLPVLPQLLVAHFLDAL